MFVVAMVFAGLATVAFAPAAGAQPGSITFDPSTVVAGGGKLFINGSCEANTSGFVISEAFANQPSVGDFAGLPAIAITTSSTGTFGIGLTIDPSVKPGMYTVTLRCGGGLAASGTLTVRSSTLAFTGPRNRTLTEAGAVLIAIGAALVLLARRKTPLLAHHRLFD
jgi:hypothetical protein